MGRYDWLYELRPVAIKEKLLGALGDHLARDLEAWPPPVEDWLSETDRARFAPLYEAPVQPSPGGFRYACHLVRLELRREYEAIDYEMRNDGWAEWFEDRRDLEKVHLLTRWLLDALLSVKEASGQNLTRGDLETVVDDLERRLAPSALRVKKLRPRRRMSRQAPARRSASRRVRAGRWRGRPRPPDAGCDGGRLAGRGRPPPGRPPTGA